MFGLFFFVGIASQSQIYEPTIVDMLTKAQLPLRIFSDQFVPSMISGSIIRGMGYNLEDTIEVNKLPKNISTFILYKGRTYPKQGSALLALNG